MTAQPPSAGLMEIEKTADCACTCREVSAVPEIEPGEASLQLDEPAAHAAREIAQLSETEVQEILTAGHSELLPRTVERRRAERRPYPVDEWLAACRQGKLPDASAFREVPCHELSIGGISFFLPRPPGFHLAVITLGRSTDATSMLIRVVHCAVHEATGRKRYLVGGQFVRRISSHELSGSHPVVRTV